MPTQTFRAALVTGASSGIGESVARVLASRGADVVVVARRAERLEQLAAELRSAYGTTVEVLPADLCAPAERATVERRLADAARPVDLLVNNAGFASTGEYADLPLEQEDAQVRLNLLVPMRLAHVALQGMVERRRGGVLNVSSLAGQQPLPGAVTYAATKAGLTTFTESLRGEVGRHGVHVTVLLPGFTDVTLDGQPRPPGIPEFMWLDRERVAREAVDAVERGRPTCVPGAQYKALAGVVGALPRSVVRAATGRVKPLR